MIVALCFAAFMVLGTVGCKSVCEKAEQKELDCLAEFCEDDANAEMCAQMEDLDEFDAAVQEASGEEAPDEECDEAAAQAQLDQSCNEMFGVPSGGGDEGESEGE
jgi:hypothetical protein